MTAHHLIDVTVVAEVPSFTFLAHHRGNRRGPPA
jgi:hypothetical protein